MFQYLAGNTGQTDWPVIGRVLCTTLLVDLGNVCFCPVRWKRTGI